MSPDETSLAVLLGALAFLALRARGDSTMRQPYLISFEANTYTLVSPVRVISTDPPITEGPFYSRPGVDPADWAYTPDARFLAGTTSTPSAMHLVQQRPDPQSPRPE